LQTEEHIVPFYEKQGLMRFTEPVMVRRTAWNGGGGR